MFIPLVFSVFGHMPAETLKFLNLSIAKGAKYHLDKYPGGKKLLVANMINATSCAFQKRNALVITITAQRLLAVAVAPAPVVP